jgi:hypothetical protein
MSPESGLKTEAVNLITVVLAQDGNSGARLRGSESTAAAAATAAAATATAASSCD